MKKSICSRIKLPLLFSLAVSPMFGGTLTFLSSPLAAVDTVDWAQLGADGTGISKNFTATSGGGVAVSGVLGGSDGLTSVVCPAAPACSWAPQPSGYSAGDTLIWAENTTNQGAGPITVSFASQFGIGAYIQATAAGAYSAQLDIYHGATKIGTMAYTSDGAGDPLFLGASDTAMEITKSVFSVTSCGSFACDPTDFTMDTLQIYGSTATATPEPGTFFGLAGALLACGFNRLGRQKRNRA